MSDSLKVMLSTDNHLGFLDKDPIRCDDSFAAFEEMLSLARETHCDMVLLSGDLFHENKPSRRTLYKTIEILRRFSLGARPVKFRVMNDVKVNTEKLASKVGLNATQNAGLRDYVSDASCEFSNISLTFLHRSCRDLFFHLFRNVIGIWTIIRS